MHVHDAKCSYDESENQSGIAHCSRCGKITAHPIEDAIQAKIGDLCKLNDKEAEFERKVNLVLSDPRFIGDRKTAEAVVRETGN